MPRNACARYRRDPCSGKSYTTQTVGGIEISALSSTRRRGTGWGGIDTLGSLARWVNVLGGSLARNTLARRDSDVKTVGMIRWEWDTTRERWH